MTFVPSVTTHRDHYAPTEHTVLSPYERLIQLISLVMIATSTLMRATVSIGIGDVYISQLIALALFPLAFWRTTTMTALLRAVAIGMVVSVAATAASVFLPDGVARYRLVVQIIVNAFTMLILASLLSRLPRKAVRQVVVVLCWLTFISAMAQAFIAPHWNARGTTTLSIPRPVLLFNEEGELAQFAALLFCAALALRTKFAAVLPALLVVIGNNRGAYIIAIAGALLAVPLVRKAPILRSIVLAMPLLISAFFVLATYFSWSVPIISEGTGSTRQLDAQAILSHNNGSLFPWGGAAIDIIDNTRSRQLQDTFNVWAIDLIWKFGFGGLIILAAWVWIFLKKIPASIASTPDSIQRWVPLAALFGLVADLQFNNPSGFPWTWLMIGTLYIIMSFRDTQPSSQSVEVSD